MRESRCCAPPYDYRSRVTQSALLGIPGLRPTSSRVKTLTTATHALWATITRRESTNGTTRARVLKSCIIRLRAYLGVGVVEHELGRKFVLNKIHCRPDDMHNGLRRLGRVDSNGNLSGLFEIAVAKAVVWVQRWDDRLTYLRLNDDCYSLVLNFIFKFSNLVCVIQSVPATTKCEMLRKCGAQRCHAKSRKDYATTTAATTTYESPLHPRV